MLQRSADEDKSPLGIGCEQHSGRNRLGMILLGKVAELLAADGDEGLVDLVEAGEQQVSAAEANALQAQETLEKMGKFAARRGGLVPAGILPRIGGQLGSGGHGLPLQRAGHVGADGVADLAEGIAIAGVDAIEVTHAALGHI